MNAPKPENQLQEHHDRLPPQLPFHLDKHESNKEDASQKSAPTPESETQGRDSEFYNGMSQ